MKQLHNHTDTVLQLTSMEMSGMLNSEKLFNV